VVNVTSDSPRQWTLTWRETDKPGVKAWVCSGPVLPGNEPIRLVEESSLREVEAERDDWKRHFTNEQSESMRYRNWYAEQAAARNREVERADQAEARVERLEADLQEARDTFQEIATYLHTDEGETHNADACGVDACIFCLAEVRAKEGLERARGVLRKGDTDAG
jgi:DNA repair photolyase